MEDQNTESAPAPATTAPADKTVPYERFQQATAGRREALSRVAELEDQVRALQGKAGTAETLAASLRDMEAKYQTVQTEWQTERALYAAGLTDPDGIEVARMFYAKLDAKERPALPEWIKGIKADPSTAPRALQAYLGQAEPVAAPAQPVEPSRPAPPNSNRGAVASSAAASATAQGFDAAAIRRLSEEARRTGDYSKLREAMPAIRASLKA
jgi:hypothetical protein